MSELYDPKSYRGFSYKDQSLNLNGQVRLNISQKKITRCQTTWIAFKKFERNEDICDRGKRFYRKDFPVKEHNLMCLHHSKPVLGKAKI